MARQYMLCAVFTVVLLAGCTTAGQHHAPELTGNAMPSEAMQQAVQKRTEVDQFAMAPARLEKGHIFMRRTEDWEQERARIAAEAERKQRFAALQNGAVREYIQADGTIVRKKGIVGQEYEQQVDYLPAHEWIDLAEARVALHVENKPFEDVMQDVMREVLPYTGPWRLQWKISRENLDLLNERFSLNTETSFDNFAAHVTNFILNHRGIELVFEKFEKDRILVVSDKI